MPRLPAKTLVSEGETFHMKRIIKLKYLLLTARGSFGAGLSKRYFCFIFYSIILHMPKVFTSDKQKIGKLGEELAKRFLVKHGYSILEENYTKKYGEIDLIAKKNSVIHFIEVKSIVSHETKVSVTHLPTKALESESETYDPIQNLHPMKLRRLSRVIQVYLLNVPRVTNTRRFDEPKWQFDLITVKINEKDRIGTVKHIKDIVI